MRPSQVPESVITDPTGTIHNDRFGFGLCLPLSSVQLLRFQKEK